MDINIALDTVEAYINGSDELGDVSEEDASAALEVIRAEINQLHLAAAADMSRLLEAATKAGILYTGCDTPDTLADAVLAARARIAELEAERMWIPVEERLPEVVYHVSEYVWVATKYGVATCTYVPVDWPVDKWTYRRGWYLQNHGEPIDDIVTHWQPLPPPPQEG